MEHVSSEVVEGVFGFSKPSGISSGQVILDLQRHFSTSTLFAPLLAADRRKTEELSILQPSLQSKREEEESNGRFFRMGHGGTLDPMASGVLIVGIGRGTKALQSYLGCTKTYETVVLFGKSTDTYDCDGVVVEEADCSHVSEALVREKLAAFRGPLKQMPPLYSALKINGVKACDYLRAGKELPRELEAREVAVDECEMLEWMGAGEHGFRWPGDSTAAPVPAARIRLTVSSGFYVRSFAYDLGAACGTLATMAELVRTRQADFTSRDEPQGSGFLKAISYAELDAGEDAWGPVVAQHLSKWMDKNPAAAAQHINGRDPNTKKRLNDEEKTKIRQRFRGEYVGLTRNERRRQQKKAKAEAETARQDKADTET